MRTFDWKYPVIALMLLVGAGERLRETFHLTTLTHDGSISYLAAAGKQDDFSKIFARPEYMYARWVTADRWKQLLIADQPFCFWKIQHGLKQHDIHPPMYFWLLHCWMLLFGTHAWTGPLLNQLIALGTGTILYFLFLQCFQNRLTALIAVCLWYVSPAVIALSLVARQYDLMTLFGLLLIWRTVWAAHHPTISRLKESVLIGFTCAAGLLTHFHFALVIAGCVLYLFIFVKESGWKTVSALCLAMVLGVVLFVVMYGDIQPTVARARLQAQAFNWEDFWNRVEKVWLTLSGYWGQSKVMSQAAKLFAIGALVLFCFQTLSLFKPSWTGRFAINPSLYPLGFFFVWTSVVTIALYLNFSSPGHAMTNRYLCLTWPFMAGLFVMLLRFIPQNKDELCIAAGITLLVVSIQTQLQYQTERPNTPNSDPVPIFQKAEGIIIDMAGRGYLFPAVYQLRDDQYVFVANQRHILENIDHLQAKTFSWIAYYNMNAYGNTVEMGQRIVDSLQRDYRFQVKGTVWDTGPLLFGYKIAK